MHFRIYYWLFLLSCVFKHIFTWNDNLQKFHSKLLAWEVRKLDTNNIFTELFLQFYSSFPKNVIKTIWQLLIFETGKTAAE